MRIRGARFSRWSEKSTCLRISSRRSGAIASAARRERSISRSASCRASPACRKAAPLSEGRFSISPSVEYLERAYDEAKYGEFSSRPYLDMVIPSLLDPSMAPPGKHVMSIFVQYAPYRLNGGWTDARREAFG
jgi:phytoene dehydrogenase-like protein